MKDTQFKSSSWHQALESLVPKALLSLDGYHLSAFPEFAPVFADLTRELRFSDLGDFAKAAFVFEVLVSLRTDGAAAATVLCQKIIAVLEREYARRHPNAWLAA